MGSVARTAPSGAIVLKLSGEAMAGRSSSWDGVHFEQVADQIEQIVALGFRCGVVIGGGNYIRAGVRFGDRGLDSHRIDELGMLASGWNALALASTLSQMGGMKPKIIAAPGIAAGFSEPWDVDTLGQSIDEVFIVAGGVGKYNVSTDVAAPVLAHDMKADRIIMAKHNVEGIYDKDPNRLAPDDAPAIPQPLMRIDDALKNNINIMDREAMGLCRSHGIVVHVVGAEVPDSLVRAVRGESLGSILYP